MTIQYAKTSVRKPEQIETMETLLLEIVNKVAENRKRFKNYRLPDIYIIEIEGTGELRFGVQFEKRSNKERKLNLGFEDIFTEYEFRERLFGKEKAGEYKAKAFAQYKGIHDQEPVIQFILQQYYDGSKK